ncbi:hypothetical protein EPN29_01940 [bacterium]|nr:MAG: hypothetical protein EPN29_01940 [bacterium]
MTPEQARRRDRQQVLDFERQRKVEGLLAWLRQLGIMRYGPATPSPDEDLVSIKRLAAFRKYKVLSWDAIQHRKDREEPLEGSGDQDEDGQFHTPAIDRYVHSQWLTRTFE